MYLQVQIVALHTVAENKLLIVIFEPEDKLL